MKQIVKVMTTVNLGYCPACEKDRTYLKSRASIVEPGDEPKFCEHCGTSNHVQRKVDICPFCHEPVLRWTGHLSSPCDVYDSYRNDVVVIYDTEEYHRIELAKDPDGDLWMIPYETDYDMIESQKPEPTSLEALRKALNDKTRHIHSRIRNMWDSAYKLGLAHHDDVNQ